MTLINIRKMTQSFTALCHQDHIVPKHIILRAAKKWFWLCLTCSSKHQVVRHMVKDTYGCKWRELMASFVQPQTLWGSRQFSSSSSGKLVLHVREAPPPSCLQSHSSTPIHLPRIPKGAHGTGLLPLCCSPEGLAGHGLLCNHRRAFL